MSSPLFSILVPVWNPVVSEFEQMLDSVFAQTDEGWELVLAVDGPQSNDVEDLLNTIRERNSVVVVQRGAQGGISAATNDALAVASGEFVVFADNDDVLAIHAIAAFRSAVGAQEDVDVVYSDENKLDNVGNQIEPFHKPAWSPERLRSQMYLGHLCAFRRSLVEAVGGLREEFNGSQDHDLALRVTERARRITHVPRVLYHWRQSVNSTALDPSNKAWAYEAGVRAVQSQLDRLELPGIAVGDPALTGIIDIVPELKNTPLVSIIMLTGGHKRRVRGRQLTLVRNAIRSVVATSSYPNFEIVVVTDASVSHELADELVALAPQQVRVVANPATPFSFSASNNVGVEHARGDSFIFLNDDTEVITPDWIERFVFHLSQDRVGAVGCRLEYPDGTIQHAGVFARDGNVSHRYRGYANDAHGAFGALRLTMNCLSVTGACLGISRNAYREVGGFSAELPLNFNDVDLCLKLVAAGYRNIVDNQCTLVHLETSSRPDRVEAYEADLLQQRWGTQLRNDPWNNPHLFGGEAEEVASSPALTLRRELADSDSLANRSWSSKHPFGYGTK